MPSTSIKTLIKGYLQHPRYQAFWIKNIVTTAWHNLFPHAKSQLKKIAIKNSVAYIWLESLILSNDLSRKKQVIVQQLQQEITKLEQDAKLVKDVVFC